MRSFSTKFHRRRLRPPLRIWQFVFSLNFFPSLFLWMKGSGFTSLILPILFLFISPTPWSFCTVFSLISLKPILPLQNHHKNAMFKQFYPSKVNRVKRNLKILHRLLKILSHLKLVDAARTLMYCEFSTSSFHPHFCLQVLKSNSDCLLLFHMDITQDDGHITEDCPLWKRYQLGCGVKDILTTIWTFNSLNFDLNSNCNSLRVGKKNIIREPLSMTYGKVDIDSTIYKHLIFGVQNIFGEQHLVMSVYNCVVGTASIEIFSTLFSVGSSLSFIKHSRSLLHCDCHQLPISFFFRCNCNYKGVSKRYVFVLIFFSKISFTASACHSLSPLSPFVSILVFRWWYTCWRIGGGEVKGSFKNANDGIGSHMNGSW